MRGACKSEVKVDGTACFLIGSDNSYKKLFGVFRFTIQYLKFCVCFTADAFSI